MWWFAICYFVNTVFPHKSLIYNDEYRLFILGFPLNILDGLLAVGGIFSVLWPLRAASVPRLHPAFTRGLIFLTIALVLGVVQSFIAYPDLPSRLRLVPIRNFLLVPLSMYIAYRSLRNPSQIRTAFWIIFISSIGSAIAAIITAGQTTALLASRGGVFDQLRVSAQDVSGDAGILAASLLFFSMAANIRFLWRFLFYPAFAICAAGMFLLPHRNTWVLSILTCGFAGLVLWPFDLGHKLFTTSKALFMVLAASLILIVAIDIQTERGFSGWVYRRLESLLPDQQSSQAKAWDTRLPGMVREFLIWTENPILGRGFGAPEAYGIRIAATESYRHTPWMTTLCETGLPGLAGFVLVIGGLTIVGTRLARQGPDKWFMLLGAIGASWGLVCLLAGFMTLHWNSPRPAITLGLLAGLIFRARDLSLISNLPEQPTAYVNDDEPLAPVPLPG